MLEFSYLSLIMEKGETRKEDDTQSDINAATLAESSKDKNDAMWLDNSDNKVEEVFGFNKNAELVNSRAAMLGFLMMILTELLFRGTPVTRAIFGIN